MNKVTEDIVILIALICLSATIGFVGNNLYTNWNIHPILSNAEYSTCNNLSLSETSNCLKNDLNEWYFYNLSNMDKELSISQLKESGGVCTHFSNWYKDNYINLGFNAKLIDLSSDDIRHEFVIAWTKNLSNGEYCIADQTKTACFNLGEINMTLYGELLKNEK